MNALVAPLRPRLTKLDDAILWLCVKHPPMRRVGIARILGVTESSISQAMNRLAHLGYIDRGRGSCIPRPAALNYVSMLAADGFEMTFRSPVEHSGGGGQAVDREPNRQQASEQSTTPAVLGAMEPRGSIVRPEEPPLTEIIDRLASFQDPLLAQANAQLRLRVSELEAENARLRSQVEKTLQRLGFAADALTG